MHGYNRLPKLPVGRVLIVRAEPGATCAFHGEGGAYIDHAKQRYTVTVGRGVAQTKFNACGDHVHHISWSLGYGTDKVSTCRSCSKRRQTRVVSCSGGGSLGDKRLCLPCHKLLIKAADTIPNCDSVEIERPVPELVS